MKRQIVIDNLIRLVVIIVQINIKIWVNTIKFSFNSRNPDQIIQGGWKQMPNYEQS